MTATKPVLASGVTQKSIEDANALVAKVVDKDTQVKLTVLTVTAQDLLNAQITDAATKAVNALFVDPTATTPVLASGVTQKIN